jgi:hypothetical protein
MFSVETPLYAQIKHRQTLIAIRSMIFEDRKAGDWPEGASFSLPPGLLLVAARPILAAIAGFA